MKKAVSTKLKTDNREFKIISKEEAKKMIDENPETKLNK